MTLKEKIQKFIFRLKIFAWYLFTEPIRQIQQILSLFSKSLEELNKTLSWVYVILISIIISLYLGNKKVASIFITVLLIIILVWEWQRGFFMKRFRDKTKERIKKKFKEEDLNDRNY